MGLLCTTPALNNTQRVTACYSQMQTTGVNEKRFLTFGCRWEEIGVHTHTVCIFHQVGPNQTCLTQDQRLTMTTLLLEETLLCVWIASQKSIREVTII